LQGKIVHGGTFNGNEEEGKKEETLSRARRIPRIHHGFSLASREKHLLRGFSVDAKFVDSASVRQGRSRFWWREILQRESGGCVTIGETCGGCRLSAEDGYAKKKQREINRQ
jgi:hypothetical protein